MAELKLPVSEEEIRKLKVGDFVELTGRMITGRDTAHHWLMQDLREDVMPYMKDTVIYHCGPVVSGLDTKDYRFVAAGPTTSGLLSGFSNRYSCPASQAGQVKLKSPSSNQLMTRLLACSIDRR